MAESESSSKIEGAWFPELLPQPGLPGLAGEEAKVFKKLIVLAVYDLGKKSDDMSIIPFKANGDTSAALM